MRRRFATIMAVLAIAASAPLAHGAGFLIYEHGAAAMGMAGTGTAIAHDASTMWHNPAGIAFLPGTQFSLGGTLILPSGSVTLPNWGASGVTVKQEKQTFLPPNVYLSHSFGRWAVGLGVFAPFGLGTKWPMGTNAGAGTIFMLLPVSNDNPLRWMGYENSMSTIFINPNFAFKVTDNIAVSAGVSYIMSTLKAKMVERYPFFVFGLDLPVSLEGDGNSFSFNLAALYKGDAMSAGVSYRSGFDIDYDGTLTIDNTLIPAFPATAKGTTTFKFPDIIGAGVTFNLSPKALVALDLNYVLWSRYDAYTLHVEYPGGGESDLPVTQNFKNAFTFRGGFQYELSPVVTLRLGGLYDQTPQPVASMDPNLPDANRFAGTAGLGFKLGKLRLDVAYQYEPFNKRSSVNRDYYAYWDHALPETEKWGYGTYTTKSHLIGVSLSAGF